MNHLLGVRVYANSLLVRERRIESRVRGGYMNRWLIRKVDVLREPYAVMAADHLFGGQALYAHPEVLARMRRVDPTSMRANP